jgi:sensor domain CHASE-containing protein/signal transduction histidine kinase
MSLRHKILWSIVSVLLVLLVVLSFFMSAISLQRFMEIEEKMIDRNLERLQYLIEEELNHLTIQTRDYAVWDQTYQYMQTKNESYLIENFSHANLDALNLNWMGLLTLEGDVLFGQSHDLINHNLVETPKELINDLSKYKKIWHLNLEEKSESGILLFSDYPMLFSTHAILNSQRQGPILGSLMMGRYLTADKLQEFSKRLQLDIKMQMLNKTLISPDFEQAWQKLKTQQKNHFVQTLSTTNAAGYLLLYDIDKKPSLILKIIFTRDIYQQGLISVYYINGAIIITGFFFIIVLLLLVDKLILSRLTKLSDAMSHVSLEPKQLQALKIDEYNDELTQLVITINTMLLSLHDNHQQLKRSETRLKTAQRIAHVGHWEWNLNRDEHYWSEELFNLFKLNPEKNKENQSLFLKHVPISETKIVQSIFTQTLKTGQASELEHHIIDAQGQERILHTRIECLNLPDATNQHLIATVQDVTEMRRVQAETERLLTENRFLIHRFIDTQEQERSYLARELHDQFGQSITAIQAETETILDLVRSQQISGQIDAKKLLMQINIGMQAILPLSDQMYNVMHNLLQYLRPSGLEELGLETILREVIRHWQNKHPEVNCEFAVFGCLSGFSEQVNITIYRIIQECLKNITRHSQATAVKIDLIFDAEKSLLNLRIVDNGKGINPNKKWGIGLIGIRERVQALRGELLLQSQPMKGVNIFLSLPIICSSLELKN